MKINKLSHGSHGSWNRNKFNSKLGFILIAFDSLFCIKWLSYLFSLFSRDLCCFFLTATIHKESLQYEGK